MLRAFCLVVMPMWASSLPRALPGLGPGAVVQLAAAWPGCVRRRCSWAALTLTATLNLES